MKQLFIGVTIGVFIWWAVVFFTTDLFTNETSYTSQFIDASVKNSEFTNTNSSSLEPEISEEHRVSVRYIENNLDDILSSSWGIAEFFLGSPFPSWAALSAIKNKNEKLWISYWMSLYDWLDTKPSEREEFKAKISLAYEYILDDSLIAEENIPYLLDGAIYFSENTINEKRDMCERLFPTAWSVVPDDGVKYCVSMSYMYEAIKTDDVSFCTKISYIPKNTALIENCEALLNDK